MARYFHAPKLVHWKAVLRVLVYVRFTSSYGITFQRGTARGVGLEVFVDSDFASRATDRRSVSSGVAMCAGACVAFFSRTQKSVALSSAAAEYVAMAEGFKEAIFLRYIWSFVWVLGRALKLIRKHLAVAPYTRRVTQFLYHLRVKR